MKTTITCAVSCIIAGFAVYSAPTFATPAPTVTTPAQRVISGFGTTPESCAFGPDGKIYVSVVNQYEVYGDGYIGVVEGSRLRPLARGLNDPHGITFWNNMIFAADNRGQIWKITMAGVVSRVVDSTQFPRKITNFNDIEVDPANGDIFVSDSGDFGGRGGAIYKITQAGEITTILTDEQNWKLISPNGLKLDGKGGLLVYDWTTGILYRLDLTTKAYTKVNPGVGPGDGIALGGDGSVYLGAYFQGVIKRGADGTATSGDLISLADLTAKSVADIAISADGRTLCVPDFDGNQVIIRTLR
jgi:gluconolactonase